MTVTVVAPQRRAVETTRPREGVMTVALAAVFYFVCYNRLFVARGVLWFAPAIIVALLHRDRIARVRVNGVLFAFVLWLGLCTTLAGFPKGSFMLMLLLGAIFTGVVLGSFGLEVVGRGLLIASGVLVTASVVLCIGGWWDRVREQDPLYAGAWKGLFNQKNGLAFTAALTIVLCVAQYRMLSPFVARALIAISAVALVESRGMSAVGALAYAFAIYVLWSVMRKRGKRVHLRHVVAATVALTATVMWVLPTLLTKIGRDPTLTGRTVVWNALWPDAKTVLTYGHGVGAYWFRQSSQTTLNTIMQTLHFRPGQAHNGALEVVLDAGVPALVLLVALVWSSLRRAVSYLSRGISWPLFAIALVGMLTITDRGVYSAPSLLILAAIVSAPLTQPRAREFVGE